MVTRAEQKERTRLAILHAARKHFVERGFRDTSIREVAKTAGVGLGSVNAHFGDKTALLLACFRTQILEAVAVGWRLASEKSALVDKLIVVAEALYAAYCQHPELSRQMLATTLFGEDGDGALTQSFLDSIAELFRAALERHELSKLPQHGVVAANNYFAVYLFVLIGGLKGVFGPVDNRSPQVWGAALRVQLEAQMSGL